MASDKKKMKAEIDRIRDKLKITKVVATRSVKGRGGDAFVGFSAAWDTTQEDGGKGLVDTMDDESGNGMTLKEARVSALILGLAADRAAHENAVAGSIVTPEEHQAALKGIYKNYGILVEAALTDKAPTEE